MLSGSTETVNADQRQLDTQQVEVLYRLAQRMARRFGKPAHHDPAGYEEAALLAVARAVNTWDPARGATLAGYAAYLVEKALLREYAHQKLPAGISLCSLDVPVGDGDARLEELLPSDDPTPEEVTLADLGGADLFTQVHAALSHLSDRQQELLLLMFWHELPLPVAAKRLRMPMPIAKRHLEYAFGYLGRALAGGAE